MRLHGVVTGLTGFAEGKSGAPGGGVGRLWLSAMAGLRHIGAFVPQAAEAS
jgi:hypothetical protein